MVLLCSFDQTFTGAAGNVCSSPEIHFLLSILKFKPTVVMYSAPGWGKTTLLTHALKMVSRMSRLCSNQVAI